MQHRRSGLAVYYDRIVYAHEEILLENFIRRVLGHPKRYDSRASGNYSPLGKPTTEISGGALGSTRGIDFANL